LTVYRNSGDIVLNGPNYQPPSSSNRSHQTIYGIVGLITLSLSEYIIIVTGREKSGSIMGEDVYNATEYDILPLNPNVSVQNPPHPVEAHLLALVRSHLNGGLFFFSYGWDITRRLQAQWLAKKNDVEKGFWEVADDRFFWNKFLQSRLIDVSLTNSDQDLSGYILPLLYGTVDFRKRVVHNQRIQICLISRRSRYRAGTRYFRRGIDQEGHVANFNETEQMVFIDNPHTPGATTQLSFIQTRGSVPVYWAEINTLRYKPDLQIMELQNTTDATRLHLQEQVAIYGDQSLVNLVNHKGHEAPVKQSYEKQVTRLNFPNVRYEYFDFHNECKHMRWDRISVLIDKMREDLDRHGWFCLDDTASEPEKLQSGAVRTNCMDNLDRTNVAQAAFAKFTLTKQLRELGIFGDRETVDDHDGLTTDLREMWADHADLISKAYSGTGALKTDFTRTGKRTKNGALEDGYKSVLRYLKNNFLDGARQDAFDLMTGVWVPRGPSSAVVLITDSRPVIVRSMPYAMGFSFFMICAGLTLPRTSDYSLLYYFLLWLTVFGLSTAFTFIHGLEYVSWPRLMPLTDVIYYDGPGFRSAHHGKGFGIPALDVAKWKSNRLLAQAHRRAGSRLEEIEMGAKKRVD